MIEKKKRVDDEGFLQPLFLMLIISYVTVELWAGQIKKSSRLVSHLFP